MRADFYHLTASPIEKLLPRICERVLAEGQRLVITGEEPMLDQLDAQLWAYARDAFLPHGRAGDPQADRQPILLAAEISHANSAQNVLVADGRWRDEALGFERLFYVFDGSRIDEARKSWVSLKGRNEVTRRYWKQDERGKWVEGP